MPAGGFMGSPNSIKALKERGNRGWSHVPQCCRPHCRQPAVFGVRACKMHGGAAHIRKVTPRRRAIRAARAVIRAEKAEGTLPPDLVAQPIWHAVQRARFIHHWPLLLAAWRSPDPAAWGAALAAAERDTQA